MRVLRFGLVVVLTCQLAVWESFLVGARPFGVPLPVSAALAVVGNLVLGVAGARTLGHRTGAVVPAALWVLIVLALASSRSEGDVVVPDSFRGLAFLLLGTLAAAAPLGLNLDRRRLTATPGAVDGR